MKVMRPYVPYFVILSNKRDMEALILHDFCLIFPEQREKQILKAGYRIQQYPSVVFRRDNLIQRGYLKVGDLGTARVGLLDARSFLSVIRPELETLIERNRKYYDPDTILASSLPLM